MKEKFRLEETEWAAVAFTISSNSRVSYIMFCYTFTTSMSQNTDLLSELENAALSGVGRVWTAIHRKGIITEEVCVKQTKLYTSPMLPDDLGQDFIW